jgi:serine/threonine-protein kinase
MQDQDIKTVRVERTFILLQPIGDGAYGTVYDAFDSWSGQHAAIKILKTEFASDEAACKRFEDEAVLTAFVDHPSTLPVYGSGRSEDGRPFYVMKKVQGRTLENLLQERGERASDQGWIARLLSIFTQVCEGVADAHAHGIIHRDLKPENIIVSNQDYATILDWGLAKRHSVTGSYADSNRTVSGLVMGSPGYMAPEQARGESEKAGPQADVFSLGVILYRILTAVQPPRVSAECRLSRPPRSAPVESLGFAPPCGYRPKNPGERPIKTLRKCKGTSRRSS